MGDWPNRPTSDDPECVQTRPTNRPAGGRPVVGDFGWQLVKPRGLRRSGSAISQGLSTGDNQGSRNDSSEYFLHHLFTVMHMHMRTCRARSEGWCLTPERKNGKCQIPKHLKRVGATLGGFTRTPGRRHLSKSGALKRGALKQNTLER